MVNIVTLRTRRVLPLDFLSLLAECLCLGVVCGKFWREEPNKHVCTGRVLANSDGIKAAPAMAIDLNPVLAQYSF